MRGQLIVKGRLCCAALIVLGSVTACGGGGGKKATMKQSVSATTSTAPESTSTTPANAAGTSRTSSASGSASTSTRESDAAAKAKAQKVLLVQGDFPAGWKGSVHERTAQDKQDEKDFAACVGGVDEAAYAADEDGLSFENGNSTVDSSVAVVRTDADYRKDASALQGPQFEPCLKQQLTKVVEREGASVKQISTARFAVEPHGTLAIGMRATITASGPGGEVTLYSDSVFYGKQRVELTVSFTSINSKFDPTLEANLTSIAGKRLDAAA